ncbi:MAG: hypothetical protein AAGF94_00110 [Pseudomonadota bacterium]
MAKTSTISLLVLGIALGAMDAGTAASEPQDVPLSAIPWLSEVIDRPAVLSDPFDKDAPQPLPPPTPIGVTPLADVDPDATGLRREGQSDLWAASDAARIAELMRGMPRQSLPAAQDLFTALLLSEGAPPKAAPRGESDFLRARVDALILQGALEPALALLERAGPERPELFRRWFDISLLTGFEKRACATMAATPSLAPTAAARVFCLARAGRWETAVVTLEASAALGTLSISDADRMARFLDPELFEGAAQMPWPDPVTPLLFRVHEALGEPIPTRGLPLAFAHADLRHVIGWKSRIEAAERLARAGAVSGNQLLGIYAARQPSASGGVWDRVAAMQALDVALNSGSHRAVVAALEPARSAMAEAGLEPVFAGLISPRLERITLTGEAAEIALRLRFLSNGPSALRPSSLPPELSPELAFAAAIAADQAALAAASDPRSAAIRAALSEGQPHPADASLLDQGRTGEALLEALALLAPGGEADPREVARALAILRATDRDETAPHIALQYLLLDPAR